MKKIFIVTNQKRKPKTVEHLRQVLPWLSERASIIGIDRNGSRDLSRIEADLIVVLGGDGTMLGVARKMKGNPIPVVGVNLGQLGFLAEINPAEFKTLMPKILEGNYQLSPRMMLEVRVTASNKGARSKSYLVLNDAVLLRLPRFAMMAVDVSVSGEPVAQYKGDGLIVSTATGSTGYSLSAGGPILSERLKAIIIAPVCAHTLASRPIVLSGEEVVEVVPYTRNGSMIELVMDGQVSCALRSGTRVEIRRAEHEFNLISTGMRGRYEIIRDKLQWAGWVKEKRK